MPLFYSWFIWIRIPLRFTHCLWRLRFFGNYFYIDNFRVYKVFCVNISSVKGLVPILPKRYGIECNKWNFIAFFKLNHETQKEDLGQMLKDFVCHDEELFFFFKVEGEPLKAFMSEVWWNLCFGNDHSDGREVFEGVVLKGRKTGSKDHCRVQIGNRHLTMMPSSSVAIG